MMEVINKMIFPAPDASYSITTRSPGARLVHIRRPNESQRFTVGYYLSPTLARMDSKNNKTSSSPTSSNTPPPTTPTTNSNNSCVDDDAPPISEAARGRYSDLENGRVPPSHLLLYAHPNACDIAMLLQELQYVSGVCNVDVLIWEFRGYGMCGAGDSGVEPSEIDLYRDMEATFEFATNTLGYPASRIILSGRSIGTGPTVQLASYLPSKYRRNASKEEVAAGGGPLAGVLLQCPFTSIQDSVDSLIDINATKYTRGLFSGSIKSVARSVVSDRFRSIDAIEHLFWPREEVPTSTSSSSSPVVSSMALNASVSRLVIQHGSEDTIVPNTHSIALVEKIRARLAKQLGLNYPFPARAAGAVPATSSSASTSTEPAFNLMGSHYDGGKSDAAAASAASATSTLSPEEATLKEAIQELVHLELCRHDGHNDLSVETMAELLSEYIIDPSNLQLSRASASTSTTPFTHIDVLLRLESYCVGPSFFWNVYAVDEGTHSNAGGNTEADESSLTTLGEWTHSILPRVIPDMGDTLRRIGGSPPPSSTKSSTPFPLLLLQDVCRIDPHTQKQLSQVMTASISSFMNHAAIRWLRAKRLTKLRQIIASRPDRAEKYKGVVAMISEYYSAVPPPPPTSDDTTTASANNNISDDSYPVGGGAPLSDAATMESRARRGAPLGETASLAGKTRDLTTGFILEHIALYGNPLGIYLLPNLERRPLVPSSTSEPLPISAPQSDPNVVVFGSLINAETMKAVKSDSNTTVPYRSWYTHTVFDSPPTTQVTAKTEVSSTSSAVHATAAAVSSPTFASSKKMKRLTERLPRVPIFECELSNNLMVLVKSFLDSLEVAESGLESLNEFELNDLCGVVAVEKTALRLSERQVDKIQMECERIVLALMEEDAKEATSSTAPTSSSSVLSTLLKPVARLLFSKQGGSGSDEDGLLTDLYLPNDLYNETLPMPIVLPCRLLSALDSDFSREYYSLTGDLETMVKDVENRLAKLVSEGVAAAGPQNNKSVADDDNDGSDEKLQGASQDSYSALLFTLQGALLRNSPESLVGAVGDTSHHPTFIAVRLLTTIYYRHYLPTEALRSSPSTLSSFHTGSPALLKNAAAGGASASFSTHQYVNRVYVPSMVGGSGADVLRYIRAHRKESLNDPERDALLYIRPGGKTSAAGSGDCSIM